MRKTLLAISAILVCSASLAGCATNQRSASYQLEQQNVSAINWMQLSGEYDALAYQAFNGARRAFDAAKPAKGRKKAVIVDLDETMIDNTAYAGWRVRQGVPFTEEAWARWMAAGQARPIAGAVEFARHVNANGGTMFYVTNRDARSFQSTAANIERLGFPGVSAKTLLLNSGQSNKQERFDSIKAEGYDVVIYMGTISTTSELQPITRTTSSDAHSSKPTGKHSARSFSCCPIRATATGFQAWRRTITNSLRKGSLRSNASPSAVGQAEMRCGTKTKSGPEGPLFCKSKRKDY